MANSNAHIITHMKQQIEFLEYQIGFCAVQNQRLYHVLSESHLFAPYRLWRNRLMFTPKSHHVHGFADGIVEECYTMYQEERSALVRYGFRLRLRLEQLSRFLVREENRVRGQLQLYLHRMAIDILISNPRLVAEARELYYKKNKNKNKNKNKKKLELRRQRIEAHTVRLELQR